MVGEYIADQLVEDCVIVELKAGGELLPEHEAQLLNYLRATPYEEGLLLNSDPNPPIEGKYFITIENRQKPGRINKRVEQAVSLSGRIFYIYFEQK